MKNLNESLAGKSYTFEDGNSITIFQIKIRDGNEPWITFHLQQGPGIPRKQVMKYDEFMNTFGHLFGYKKHDIEQAK